MGNKSFEAVHGLSRCVRKSCPAFLIPSFPRCPRLRPPPPNPPATSLQAYLRGSQTTAGSEHRVVLPRKEKLVPDSDPRLTADRVPSSRFGGVTFILCDWIKVCALSRAGAGYRGCCKQAKRTLLGMWALLRLWTAASLAT